MMLQVHGFYDGFNDTFDCVAANLVVPRFGPIRMVSNVVFNLKKSAAVRVDAGDAVKGKIKIEYGANNTQVVIDYDLKIAFVGGILQDIIPLFPTFGKFSSHLELYVAHLSRLEMRLPPTR
jgi:hypothetical protein